MNEKIQKKTYFYLFISYFKHYFMSSTRRLGLLDCRLPMSKQSTSPTPNFGFRHDCQVSIMLHCTCLDMSSTRRLGLLDCRLPMSKQSTSPTPNFGFRHDCQVSIMLHCTCLDMSSTRRLGLLDCRLPMSKQSTSPTGVGGWVSFDPQTSVSDMTAKFRSCFTALVLTCLPQDG